MEEGEVEDKKRARPVIDGDEEDEPDAKRARVDDEHLSTTVIELIREIRAAVGDDDPILRKTLLTYARKSELEPAWLPMNVSTKTVRLAFMYIDARLGRTMDKSTARSFNLSLAELLDHDDADGERKDKSSSSSEPSCSWDSDKEEASSSASAASQPAKATEAGPDDDEYASYASSSDADGDDEDDAVFTCIEYGHTPNIVPGEARYREFVPVAAEYFLAEYVQKPGTKGVYIALPALGKHRAKRVNFNKLVTEEVDGVVVIPKTIGAAKWLDDDHHPFVFNTTGEGTPIRTTLMTTPDLKDAYEGYMVLVDAGATMKNALAALAGVIAQSKASSLL
jgi:hypothetical protein